jgi:hypothetical protein
MKVFFHDDFYRVYTDDPAAAPGRMEAVMDVIKSRVASLQSRPPRKISLLSTRRTM